MQKDDWIDNASMMKPCQFCKRLIKLGRGRRINEPDIGIVYGSSCEAFPKGIPNLIFNGFWDHSESFKGDKGILFKPLDPVILDGIEYKIGWKGVLI